MRHFLQRADPARAGQAALGADHQEHVGAVPEGILDTLLDAAGEAGFGGIQRIREQIPTNQNPFHSYDKAIISVDTLKNDRNYRFYLDNANWDIIVIDECQNVAERARGAQI
jgi:hypothetical protein